MNRYTNASSAPTITRRGAAMSRTLKFRSWDSHLKFMTENVHLLDSFNEHIARDRHIVQQFTGLLDRNGVEIWESDVVEKSFKIHRKTDGLVKTLREVHAVKWGHQDGDYKQSEFDGWMWGGCGLVDGSRVTYTNSAWDCLELKYAVIGNIYEHPTLLTNDDGGV